MRLADIPSPWRYLVIALVALLLLAVLRWVDREDEASSRCACGTTVPRVSIHIKHRPGAQHLGAALFTHVDQTAAAYDDPRLRWTHLEVESARADEILDRLQHHPAIEQAFIAPTYSLPHVIVDETTVTEDDSCPINTPSFEAYQGYVGPAPQGIDAPAAWRLGARGKGVWFADIEGNWNAAHEDLPGDRITHAGGALIPDQSWRAHGTAVLGEVVGRDNGKGVVGLAPEVERIFTSSIGDTSVADAIDTAAEKLRPGDVLLIELQGGGPRGRYLPVEYWDDNYDAIEMATRRGIVVIEAAGNGAENLDHKAYKGKLERKTRDSGAIMVGAGGPARDGFVDRQRLDFSNYGSRLDVQGWGRKVATLDYGDLQNCTGEERGYTDRHYTDEFSGTSSASPIVAGAAILLESYARARGQTLPPAVVRDILRRTGTPQAGATSAEFSSTQQVIGPRPDLARAIAALALDVD
jgi:subtilisin family serine protease